MKVTEDLAVLETVDVRSQRTLASVRRSVSSRWVVGRCSAEIRDGGPSRRASGGGACRRQRRRPRRRASRDRVEAGRRASSPVSHPERSAARVDNPQGALGAALSSRRCSTRRVMHAAWVAWRSRARRRTRAPKPSPRAAKFCSEQSQARSLRTNAFTWRAPSPVVRAWASSWRRSRRRRART